MCVREGDQRVCVRVYKSESESKWKRKELNKKKKKKKWKERNEGKKCLEYV
jgi:hypothetical protein